jgi:uncharacterized zinc-type alcohol dehydrogenase-like protein
VIGRVVALGAGARGLKVGQRVGVGWACGSCMHCEQCLSGNQNLCPENAGTIVHRHGGFADRVRAQWPWAIPIPDSVDAKEAGPLLCGGVTVFTPFAIYGLKPTDRVGVVGIGGLGHMALKFAAAWGCEVTAFTSSEGKANEAREFGAHHVVNSRDSNQLAKIARTLDLVIVTVNVPLDWKALVASLRPKGRIHFVGAVLEPVPIEAFDLIGAQRDVSGSPNGAPTTSTKMMTFAGLHHILPQNEHFPIAKVNEALDRLRAGKARYRIVLDL